MGRPIFPSWGGRVSTSELYTSWLFGFLYCFNNNSKRHHSIDEYFKQKRTIGHCYRTIIFRRFIDLNPFRPSDESCSDWAENFRVALFIYLKNILFYAPIFYLALLKSYQQFCKLYFWIFLQCTGTKLFYRQCF